MAAAEAGALSGTFNGISLGGFVKFAIQTIFIGVLVGGMFDFTLFHNHPMGQALIELVNEPLMSLYDGIANFTGFSEYARNTDFMMAAADAGTQAAEAGASAGAAASGSSVCMDVDPATGMPSCG